MQRQATPAALTAAGDLRVACRLRVERALAEARATASADEPLPDGWQELTDQDGNAYFFNLSTRDMSWTRPTASSSPKAAPHDDAMLPRRANPTVAIDYRTVTAVVGGNSSRGAALNGRPPDGGATESLLPPGWAERRDEVRARAFFVHEASGRTAGAAAAQVASERDGER